MQPLSDRVPIPAVLPPVPPYGHHSMRRVHRTWAVQPMSALRSEEAVHDKYMVPHGSKVLGQRFLYRYM